MSHAAWMLRVGAWSGAVAVLAGAFGAHGLEGQVSAERLGTFQTAASYHLWHALALLATGLLAERRGPCALLRWAGVCFAGGTLLFCGSLYALVLADQPVLGMITPLGGLAFVVGWILLGLAAPTAKDP